MSKSGTEGLVRDEQVIRLDEANALDYRDTHRDTIASLSLALDGGYDLSGDFEKPFARIFVIADPHRERAEPAGMLVAWHVADELHILAVAVDATARRRGLGRALVSDAIAFAREREITVVLLEVRRDNIAALGLYESLGFARMNVRKKYYRDGEDAIELSLALAAGELDSQAPR
jgi:[ribosomal protein S18]-alanine N-acetyltransferase